MKVLLIDNYDSFTFNLYQYVGEILSASAHTRNDFQLTVKRNNEITLEQARTIAPDRIIISPGPGSPDDEEYFGVCAQVIRELGTSVPTLGVCLGMQGIVHVFGGRVVKAKLPMHGKLSPIVHNGENVFAGVPQGLEVMRYHSLIAEVVSFPKDLELCAHIQSESGAGFDTSPNEELEIMGVRHRKYPIFGIQFHPESFASEGGKDMLQNFLFL